MNDFNEFLEALAKAVTEFTEELKEVFGIVAEKIKELRDEIFEAHAEIFNIRSDRKKWREAVLLAGQRGAARAKAYSMRAQLEKARRALRRRKRLHADGGLPDW